MCSLGMVCLLKKSRNLFSFGCNSSLRAIYRSLPLLLFLPAATKEPVHLREPLQGTWMVLSRAAWSLSPVPVGIAAPNQALRGGCNARMWRMPLSKDHCMWCPGRWHVPCLSLAPMLRPQRGPTSSPCLACHRAGQKPQKQQGSTMQEAVRSVWIFTRGSVTI